MSEVELILLNNSDKCTVYTIQFLGDELDEFNKFVAKFREDSQRVFEFHFYSLKEDFRSVFRKLKRERCGHRDR